MMNALNYFFLILFILSFGFLQGQQQVGNIVNFGVSGSQNNISGVVTIEYAKQGKNKFGMRFAFGEYLRDKDKSVFDSISQHFDFGIDFSHRFVTAKQVQPYWGFNSGISIAFDKYWDELTQDADEKHFGLWQFEPKLGVAFFLSNYFGLDLAVKYPLTIRFRGGQFFHPFQPTLELKFFKVIH